MMNGLPRLFLSKRRYTRILLSTKPDQPTEERFASLEYKDKSIKHLEIEGMICILLNNLEANCYPSYYRRDPLD